VALARRDFVGTAETTIAKHDFNPLERCRSERHRLRTAEVRSYAASDPANA
jgi:hypothetical protein